MIPFLPTLARYRRWIAIGMGAMAAGAVMPFMRQTEAIFIPGMADPYIVGPYDPIIAAIITYFCVVTISGRVFDWLVGKTRSVLRGD